MPTGLGASRPGEQFLKAEIHRAFNRPVTQYTPRTVRITHRSSTTGVTGLVVQDDKASASDGEFSVLCGVIYPIKAMARRVPRDL